MTWSRVLGILSIIAAALISFAAVGDLIRPGYAAIALAVAAAINAFTERVQGGKSTVEDPTPRDPRPMGPSGSGLLSIGMIGLLFALAVTTVACDKNKLREARKATHRIEVVTTAGVDTLEAFKTEGLITREQQVDVARVMLEVNILNGELIDIVSPATSWDPGTQAAVIAKLQAIVSAVERLQAAGALHIKSPPAAEKFAAIVGAIRAALAVLQGATQ